MTTTTSPLSSPLQQQQQLTSLPPFNDEEYVHREAIEAELVRGFEAYEDPATGDNWDDNGTIEAGPSVIVVLQGKGGVGKSQVALSYAHACAASGRQVMWLPCESRALVVHTFHELCSRVGIEVDVAADEPQQRKDEASVSAGLAWLCAHPGFLLVCDNVVKIGLRELAPFLPTHGGHILVTSRKQSWKAEAVVSVIDVDCFSASEARQYIQLGMPSMALKYNNDGDKEVASATMLTEVLGRYPLALVLAKQYIRLTGCSYSAFLSLYRATPAKFTDSNQSSDTKRLQRSRQIRTAQRVVLIILRQIDIEGARQKLEVLPQALLDACARVKRLPCAVLSDDDTGAASRHRFSSASGARLAAAAQLLHRYALLALAEGDNYAMHRVLQICVRPLAMMLEGVDDDQQPVVWVSDKDAPTCHACRKKFNLVRRRHHCRRCGRVFCAECSANRERVPGRGADFVRVCDACKNEMIQRDERLMAKHLEHRRIMSIGAMSKQKHEDLTRGHLKDNNERKMARPAQRRTGDTGGGMYSSQTVPPVRLNSSNNSNDDTGKSRRTMTAWTKAIDEGTRAGSGHRDEETIVEEDETAVSTSTSRVAICPHAAEANFAFVETILDMIDEGNVGGVTDVLDQVEDGRLTLRDFSTCTCDECSSGVSPVLEQVKKDRAGFLEVLMRNSDGDASSSTDTDPYSRSATGAAAAAASSSTNTASRSGRYGITDAKRNSSVLMNGTLTKDVFDNLPGGRQRRGSLWDIMIMLDGIIRDGTMEEALQAAIDKRRFYIDRSEVEKDSESDWSSDDDYGF